MERITQIEVKYEDRIFIVKKMTPFEGIAVLKELITKAMPFDLLSLLNEDDFEGISKVLSVAQGMSKKEMSIDEFVAFQKRLIKNCYEVKKIGEVPVLQNNGDFGVEDLENNMFLVCFLLLKVIEVNYKDFFLEILRKLGMLEGTEGIIQNVKNMMNNKENAEESKMAEGILSAKMTSF